MVIAKMEQSKRLFGEVLSTYTSNQAVEDGFLVEIKSDRFPECNLMTRNLFDRLEKIAFERNLKRVFPIDTMYLINCMMLCGNKIYSEQDFKDDQDKNFFVLPKTDEGIVVWFVRNEHGKLTAMLPEDH